MDSVEWTPERARAAAEHADGEEYAWRSKPLAGGDRSLAHQFGREWGWMRSRCSEVRWTVDYLEERPGDARCESCERLAETAIAEQARILAGAAA